MRLPHLGSDNHHWHPSRPTTSPPPKSWMCRGCSRPTGKRGIRLRRVGWDGIVAAPAAAETPHSLPQMPSGNQAVLDCPYNKEGAGPDAQACPLLRLRFQTGYPALSTAPWLPEVTILE
jgi:hypothetical protein